jgi:cold shock CspA family protein
LNNLDAIPAVPVCPAEAEFSGNSGNLRPEIKHPNRGRTMHNKLIFLALAATTTLPLVAQNQAQVQPVAPRATTASPTSATPSPAARRENRDPLLDLPELPNNKVTLIGGTVKSLDEIMNKLIVVPFGSKQKMLVAFDTRTDFFQDGKPISYKSIREGQRVYLDTMLNGSTVFAKKIWIQSTADSGIGRGQVVDYDPGRKILTVRDELSNQPVKMQLTSSTVMKKGDANATAADLVPGTLVSMSFGPQRELREVTLLAKPGTTFVFAGRITYLDLSRKLIAIDNKSDNKKYDVSVDAVAPSVLRQLHEGSEVNVSAVFDGRGYTARSIESPSINSAQEQ